MKNNLSKKEVLFNIIILFLIILCVAKMFYGTFFATVILLPMLIPLFKIRKKQIKRKKQNQMETMFKDLLVSISDALKTGYSVENALRESYKDLRTIYGSNSPICVELRLMISRITLNVSTEDVFKDFAERSGLKDARLFSQVYFVAKKTGGNMTEVIKNVTDSIVLKETVGEEIEVAMSAKRMEHRIMMVIPIFLIGYIQLTSEGFLDVLYETWIGKIVMSICVAGYFLAYVWGEKIVETEV